MYPTEQIFGHKTCDPWHPLHEFSGRTGGGGVLQYTILRYNNESIRAGTWHRPLTDLVLSMGVVTRPPRILSTEPLPSQDGIPGGNGRRLGEGLA